MVKCLLGGPEFLIKMIPVHRLTATFQFNQVSSIIDHLHKCGVTVVAIICDGNQVNRAFFKKFDNDPDKPWLVQESNMYLLYDYVHLMKCIRNKWLTEKLGMISFEDETGQQCFARRSDLKALLKAEEDSLVKLSKLNFKSVHPKPVERQNVNLCLNVFSDETVTALQTHTSLDVLDTTGTVQFIKMFLQFWKIANVKSLGANLRYKDADRDVIRSPSDSQLKTFSSLAERVKDMRITDRTRIQKLTAETAYAFHHTCLGMVHLATYLLESGFDFVLLSEFSTDPLEKTFGKLRQGCGRTYFINVQQCLKSFPLPKLSLHYGLELMCRLLLVLKDIYVSSVHTKCQLLI